MEWYINTTVIHLRSAILVLALNEMHGNLVVDINKCRELSSSRQQWQHLNHKHYVHLMALILVVELSLFLHLNVVSMAFGD